jgi:GNAT superfamily N-acetyltransferase
MSGTTPIESGEPPVPGPVAAADGWRVRAASHHDIAEIVAAVRELLLELDGDPPAVAAMHLATRDLLDSPGAGAVLVAQTDDRSPAVGGSPVADGLVGVLAASWQIAIHVPGRYALIQDLWVPTAWRGKGVGAGLLGALFDVAREQAMARVEVGLPREQFAHFQATEKFYLTNGFTPNGPRMKRLLS